MSARDEILAALRRAERATPEPCERRDVRAVEGDLAERFVSEAERHLARVTRVADWPEAWNAMVAMLRERRAGLALTWDEGCFPAPGLQRALEAASCRRTFGEDAQVGITGAEAGIASLGSLVLSAGPGRPRAASLLPSWHVALLARPAIVPTVEAWFGANAARLADVSNVALITGPSRSGDIEMIVTLGVHGPGELDIILVG